MQFISKCNSEIQFLLHVFDSFNKYIWVVILNIKKVLQLLMHFQTFWINLVENLTKYG